MNQASLNHVWISYDGKTDVLEDLNLEIRPGELLSLLGPSGCGKSTTLRAIAGLQSIRKGTFLLNGEDYTKRPVHQRDFGIVFQSYALFPHLSVYENVAFGLKQRKLAKQQIHDKVLKMLSICNLDGYETRSVKQLSGGQRQRVALARALVIEPKLLLLDEPLSNLDARLRLQMRDEIRRIQRQLAITTVFVTHDQEECFAISDRVALMNHGQIEQLDHPEVIYHHPTSSYVARFIGFENFLDLDVLTHPILAHLAYDPQRRMACIRPEDIQLAQADEGLSGVVRSREFLGRFYQLQVETALGVLKVNTPQRPEEGQRVSLLLPKEKIILVNK